MVDNRIVTLLPILLLLLLLLFVVLLLAALGGGYFLYQRAQEPVLLPTPSPKPAPQIATPQPTPVVAQDEQVSALSKQGLSDEIEAIEADLNSTDLSKIDAELTNVAQEASGL